jgi:hypothetical protein
MRWCAATAPIDQGRWSGAGTAATSVAAVAAKAGSGSDSARRALQDALASISPDARPVGGPSSSSERKRGELDDEREPVGEDRSAINHVTFLGSFLTRRLDEVDRRLDELADLLEQVLSALSDHQSSGPD